MGYTHEYSQFPEQAISLSNYKNVDDTIGTLINEIETLRSQGDYLAATELIERYSDRLKQYNLDMSTINMIIEEIRNTQIKATSAGQFLSIDDVEPDGVDDGFVWIGGGD